MNSEIPKATDLEQSLFEIQNAEDFNEIALAVYNFQFSHNWLYREYCHLIKRTPDKVSFVEEIPYLPISFFKTHEVKSTIFKAASCFRSSGTTGVNTSKHYIHSLDLYKKSFLKTFESFFGSLTDYCVLGLLPSYLERQDSSLIYMVNHLISVCGHRDSGFYLYDYQALSDKLTKLDNAKQPTILFGVSYALLDFAEAYPLHLQYCKVIETGGMKGRKNEITKGELYYRLQSAFNIQLIYSEYGMTELLSQAYAINGIYQSPPWMKISLRDSTDPFTASVSTGAINIIDLANIYSCSFIATDDLGILHNDGTFSIQGRLDNSDIRGCSQLVV